MKNQELESLRQRVIELEYRVDQKREAEARIRQSEEHFRRLFSQSPIGLVRINSLGMITHANKAFLELKGTARDLVIGLNVFEHTTNQSLRQFFKQSLLDDSATWEGDYQFCSGKKAHLKLRGNPLLNDEGVVLGAIISYVDFTESKRIETALTESEERFRLLFSQSPLGITRIDPQGSVTDANQAFLDIIGAEMDYVRSLNVFKIIKAEPLRQLFSKALSGETASWEGEYLFSTGKKAYLRMVGSPILGNDGKVQGAMVIHEDISESKRFELALKESEEHFRLLVSQSPIGFTRFDVNGMITDANDSLAAMLGSAKDKLIGFNVLESTVTSLEVKRVVREALAGSISSAEGMYRSVTGVRESYLRMIACPLRNATGEIIGVMGIHEDMSEKKRLETELKESEERFRLLFFQSPLGITRIDPEGSITDTNQAFLDIIGAEMNYVTSVNVFKVVNIEPLRHMFRKALSGETASWEGEYLFTTGRKPYLRMVGSPLFSNDGEVQGAMIIHEDISERKRIEKDLMDAKKKAEAANLAKNEFLTNVSHEMRTPLNGVMGMLQLLNMTHLTEEQTNFVITALGSSKGLLTVINDILDFSKIEAGMIEIVEESFDLEEVMSTVVEIFRRHCEEKGIKLSFEINKDIPRELIGDSGRLRQILFNLIGNSLKFTEKGNIFIMTSGRELGHENIELSFRVSDTGVGIPEGKLETIFEPFTQSDGSLTRSFQGTGLGLSIVKRLVNLLGGETSIRSEPGAWTEVIFNVIMRRANMHHVSTASVCSGNMGEMQSAPKLRILVAEDDPVSRVLVIKFMENEGYEVNSVENGREALEALEAEDYDLVLMDMQMPIMDGIEAVQRIRTGISTKVDKDIPVIAMTAHAMKGDREKFLKAGMSDYIAKPINAEELNNLIAKYLY